MIAHRDARLQSVDEQLVTRHRKLAYLLADARLEVINVKA